MTGKGSPPSGSASRLLHSVDVADEGPGALATLAGGVAHDFNNILTVVSGAIHLLRLEPDLGPEARSNLDLMEEAAARGASICQRMLAYSHGGLSDFGPVDLRDIADDAVRRAAPTLGPSVRLSAEVLPGPMPVEGDAGQLATAIAAVLINAIEASERAGGGPVSLTFDEAEGVVRICVRDEGPGMDARVRRHASDPFFTTKQAGPGIGLGLSAARGIVEAHRGRIEIASAPGEGTLVTLAIPLAPWPPE